jgi:hypothetical protein
MCSGSESSSGIASLISGAGGAATEETDDFFACEGAARGALLGAVDVAAAVDGRVDDVFVDDASDARGVALLVGPSMEGRVVRGRFAAVVVVVGRAAAVFPGEDRIAVPGVSVVLRAVGLLFSSPEVTEDRSGSASDAAAERDARPVFLAAVPGAGRVGGLFRLDPAVVVREAALGVVLDAVEDVFAARDDDAAGRRAGAEVPLAAVGRRGGIESFEVDDEEAILRRAGDVVVVVGARPALCGVRSGLGAGASPAAVSLGRGGASSAMLVACS